MRAARQNEKAKQVMLDTHVTRKARREGKDVEEVNASIPTSYGAAHLATCHPDPKIRKRKAHANNGVTATCITRSGKYGKRVRR